MYPRAYTMSSWRVTSGQEVAFREAWTDLDKAFAGLGRRPLSGTLLQHRTDPTLFISLGSWTSAEDIEAMRRDEAAQDAFLRVIELCDDAEMHSFVEVAHYEHQQREANNNGEVSVLSAVSAEGDSERLRIQEDPAPPRRARRRVTRRRVRKQVHGDAE